MYFSFELIFKYFMIKNLVPIEPIFLFKLKASFYKIFEIF